MEQFVTDRFRYRYRYLTGLEFEFVIGIDFVAVPSLYRDAVSPGKGEDQLALAYASARGVVLSRKG